MQFFVSSRRRRALPADGRRYMPGEVWLLGRPEVGRRMALLTADGSRSVITSTIERVIHGTDQAVYVQTRGSVYQLQPGDPSRPRAPLADDAGADAITGRDTGRREA